MHSDKASHRSFFYINLWFTRNSHTTASFSENGEFVSAFSKIPFKRSGMAFSSLSQARATHYMASLFPYFHHPLFISAFLAFQLCCLRRQAADSNPCKRCRGATSANFFQFRSPIRAAKWNPWGRGKLGGIVARGVFPGWSNPRRLNGIADGDGIIAGTRVPWE